MASFPYTLQEQAELVAYLNRLRHRPAGWLLWSQERLDNYVAGGLDEGIARDRERAMRRRGSRAEDLVLGLLRERKQDGGSAPE